MTRPADDADAPRPRGGDVEGLLGVEPLRVGDRVQVRLSGECPDGHLWGRTGPLNGAIGIVIAIDAFTESELNPFWREHRYWVSDAGLDGDWRWKRVDDVFTRWELSRIPAPPA